MLRYVPKVQKLLFIIVRVANGWGAAVNIYGDLVRYSFTALKLTQESGGVLVVAQARLKGKLSLE